MVNIYKEENDNNIIRHVEFNTKRIPLKSLKLIHVSVMSVKKLM